MDDVKSADDRFTDQVKTLYVKCLQCSNKGPLSTLAAHSCEFDNSINSFEPGSSSESSDIVYSTPTHIENNHRMEIETQTSPILQVASTPTSSKSCNEHHSILETLHRSISSPLSKDEEKVHTHLTKRKLNFASDKATIRCKTRGQPIVMKKITKP